TASTSPIPTVTASRCCTSCRGRCGRRTSTRRRTTPSSSPRRGTRRSSTGRTTPCSRGRRDLYLDPLGRAARGPALVAFGLHLDRQAWLEVGDRPLHVRLPKQAPVQPDLRPLCEPDVHGPGGAGDGTDLLLRGGRRWAAPEEHAHPDQRDDESPDGHTLLLKSLIRRGTLSPSSALGSPPARTAVRRRDSGRPCPRAAVPPGGGRRPPREGR